MGLITLEPGEADVLVADPSPGYEGKMRVLDGTVLLSHSPRPNRDNSEKISQGDRLRISDLAGESLYARAPDTNTSPVTFNFSEVGFFAEFFPKDQVGDVQQTNYERASGTVSPNSAQTGALIRNTRDKPIFVSTVTVSLTEHQTEDDGIHFDIKPEDSNDNQIAVYFGNAQYHFPLQFDRPVYIPSGGELEYEAAAQSTNTNDITYEISAIYEVPD